MTLPQEAKHLNCDVAPLAGTEDTMQTYASQVMQAMVAGAHFSAAAISNGAVKASTLSPADFVCIVHDSLDCG
jgi:hypothetical protein